MDQEHGEGKQLMCHQVHGSGYWKKFQPQNFDISMFLNDFNYMFKYSTLVFSLETI